MVTNYNKTIPEAVDVTEVAVTAGAVTVVSMNVTRTPDIGIVDVTGVVPFVILELLGVVTVPEAVDVTEVAITAGAVTVVSVNGVVTVTGDEDVGSVTISTTLSACLTGTVSAGLHESVHTAFTQTQDF